MKDDVFNKILKRNESLQRLFEPLSVRIKALELFDFNIHPLLAAADRLTRTAPSIPPGLASLRSFGVELDKQFRLPTVLETPTLLQKLEIDAPARALAHYQDHMNEVLQGIEAMTTPWLNIKDEVRSFTGLIELQEIGHVLHTMPAFDIDAAESLWLHLGDWRANIDWPSAIFTDPLARSEFYVELGLNPSLTDFPASAFDQATTIAGIKFPPPPRIRDYDHDVHGYEQDDEEVGLERNNAAYEQLQRFETHIRKFIDERMNAAVGKNWTKHRVPYEHRQGWRHRQAKARDEGEPDRPLIAYADFTDYEPIIVQKDNWRQVFEPFFRRKTLVQESFQRLYPIRVCTMHSRLITRDDELYLHAETRRLLKAMASKT